VSWTRGDSWFSPYPLCQLYAERYPERVDGHLLPGSIDYQAPAFASAEGLVIGKRPRP
jgi:hypothetical protein